MFFLIYHAEYGLYKKFASKEITMVGFATLKAQLRFLAIRVLIFSDMYLGYVSRLFLFSFSASFAMLKS